MFRMRIYFFVLKYEKFVQNEETCTERANNLKENCFNLKICFKMGSPIVHEHIKCIERWLRMSGGQINSWWKWVCGEKYPTKEQWKKFLNTVNTSCHGKLIIQQKSGTTKKSKTENGIIFLNNLRNFTIKYWFYKIKGEVKENWSTD